MSPPKVQTGLRLDENDYYKLRTIANLETRTLNNTIEHIIRLYIRQYEQEHGPVEPTYDE